MNDEELERLATDLESDRVERKASLSPGDAKEKIGQAVCAFANDLPGHHQPGLVVVGLDDKTARPTGLKVTDQLLRNLAELRDNGNILPIPNLVVQRRTVGGQDVAVVIVQPSNDPPVRYYGQVWVRVGPRRAIASRDEERALAERRRSGDLPFDRRAAFGADLAALDLEFFRNSYLPAAVSPDVLEENGRTLDEQLRALHLLAPGGGPTHAAILLLARDPRQWLPGAYVQFVRYEGEDLTSPILDQKELDGRLPDVLRRLDDLLNINIRIQTRVEGATVEQQRPDYPAAALQQILRNAVLHRTYETNGPIYWYWFADRVEVHSPGGLYGRVTPENFGTPGATDYRNPTLAEGLKTLGFLQRFGMGIAIARKRCQENGNPEPEFRYDSPSAFLAVVRGRA